MNIDIEHVFKNHPILQSGIIWGTKANEQHAVYHFRKDFSLDVGLKDITFYITASQRYKFWLDGKLLDKGPPRQSPDRWPFVEIQVSELSAGTHQLAVEAWHWGANQGKGQLGDEGFFMLAASDAELHEQIKTDKSWLVRLDSRRTPCHERAGKQSGHCAVGTGEIFTADDAYINWPTEATDGSWQSAAVLFNQNENTWGNCNINSWLVPSTLPPMKEAVARFTAAHLLEPSHIELPSDWVSDKSASLNIPANTKAELVLDAGEITNAYPEFYWTDGKGTKLTAAWAEAPMDPTTGKKKHRDEWQDADLPGMKDEVICAQASGHWESLWYRSFRYLKLTIETADQAIALKCPRLSRTCYPLDQKTEISVADNDIINWPALHTISHRTAELCSHETFYDCPHYEQAQFPGDARIQARYHYLYANDDRLPKKAILDLMSSQLPSGLLHSHFPARYRQVISTYSLQWVGMLYDFMLYRGQADWLKQCMPAARGVMDYFLRHCDAFDGHLPQKLQAPFTDWASAFNSGNAPQEEDGGSSIVALLIAEACQWMDKLEHFAGYPELADRWQAASDNLINSVRKLCFHEASGLIADTPSHSSFSVHAQVHGILSGSFNAEDGQAALTKTLGDETYTQPGTFYYIAHLLDAARKLNMPEVLFQVLPQWNELMDGHGLTTWPERNSTQSRSDCHGWSVVPDIAMIHQVIGLDFVKDQTGMASLRLNPAALSAEAREAAIAFLPLKGKIQLEAGILTIELSNDNATTLQAEVNTPLPIHIEEEVLAAGQHQISWPLDK